MQTSDNKKVIFSGAAPSGILTIGNYIGALKYWAELQHEYRCLFCVVDLHSITVRQSPEELRRRTIEFLCQYIAAGIDPEESILFIQSHVSTHAELSWILNCYTYMGELSRMTQFKDKSAKHESNINVGLFDYPVLMAADILLYQADLVPIGEDQKQHLEITRDLAIRFNNLYGNTFKIPEAYIPKVGARIMGLQEPTKKMSKSDPNPNNYIALTDHPDLVMKKIKSAVTDSENLIAYKEGKDGVNNLLTIYSSLTNQTIDQVVEHFNGSGYGNFKKEVAEAVIEFLKPIRSKYEELINNKDYLEKIYTDGANKAYEMSIKTLRDVQEKIGFIKK